MTNHYSVIRTSKGRRTACGLVTTPDLADGRLIVTCPECRAKLQGKIANERAAVGLSGSVQEAAFHAATATMFCDDIAP